MPKLSKKQEKMALNWGLNILSRLDKGFEEGQSMGTYLEKYAKDNADKLEHALNLTYPSELKNGSSSLINIILARALTHENPTISMRAAAAIPHILAFISHPNDHVKEALTLAYDTLWYLYNKTEGTNKHQYQPILMHFLQYEPYWDVVSNEKNTLAHFAILIGDISLLRTALSKRPDMLEATNKKFGETLLYTATRYKREEIARILIEEYQADINAINSAQLNVLANTIYFFSMKTITLLLDKGCSINPFTNVIISPSSFECIHTLLSAGYFIPITHRERINARNISQYLGIEMLEFLNPLFSIVSKDDPDKFEIITGAEALRECKLIPSEKQMIRLRKSFEESMVYDKSGEIKNLYKVFLEKFLGEDTPQESQYTAKQIRNHNLKDFPLTRIIHEGIKNAKSIDYINMLNHLLKELLHPDSIDSLTLSEHQRLLKELTEVCISTYNLNLSDPELHPVQQLIYKAAYKYCMKVLPMVIKSSSREYLIQNESIIIDIFTIGSNYVLCEIDDLAQQASDVAYSICALLAEKNITQIISPFIAVVNHIFNAHFYVKNEFYTELLDSLQSIAQYKSKFKKNNNIDTINNNMMLAIYYTLHNMAINKNHLDTQSHILAIIHHFLHEKNNLEQDQLFNDLSVLQKKTDELLDAYYEAIYRLSSPLFRYTYSKDNKSILITFHEEYDPRKIKLILSDIHELTLLSGAYRLTHVGLSLADLNEVIDDLNSITEEQITHTSPSEAPRTNPSIAPQEQGNRSYYLPSASVATRRPIRLSKSKSTVIEPTVSQPTQEIKPNIQEIAVQILDRLGLPVDSHIYHMEHPRYPAQRKHLCWGIWIPGAMTKRPEAITDEILERHFELLKNQARLDIPAKGANGFKIACFFNVETGKNEYTYKTKLAYTKERVMAIPYQVTLPSHEKATVYCFGIIDADHSDELIHADPRTFLEPFKVKARPPATTSALQLSGSL